MPSNDRNNLLPFAGIGLKLKFSLLEFSHFLLVDYTLKDVVKLESTYLVFPPVKRKLFAWTDFVESVSPFHI